MKRDTTTKEKALNDLYNALKPLEALEDSAVSICWAQLYPKLAIEVSSNIRQTSHKVQAIICNLLGKKSIQLLKLTAGTWVSSKFDADRLVALEASSSFTACFNSDKKRDSFYSIFETQIMDYLIDIFNYQSVDTLSDTRYVTKDDAKYKHDRVLKNCLSTLAFMIERKPESFESHPAKNKSILKSSSMDAIYEIIGSKNFWKLTTSSNHVLAKAAFLNIPKILTALPSDIIDSKASDIFSWFVKKPMSASPHEYRKLSLDIIQALTTIVTVYPEIISSSGKKESKKNTIYYFAKFIERGNVDSNSHFWHSVMRLLLLIPEEYSPLKGTYENNDNKKMLVEAISTATKNGSIEAAQSTAPLSARNELEKDTWSFYLTFIEKICGLPGQSQTTRSKLLSMSFGDISDSFFSENSKIHSKTKAFGRHTEKSNESVVSIVATKFSQKLWSVDPSICIDSIKTTLMSCEKYLEKEAYAPIVNTLEFCSVVYRTLEGNNEKSQKSLEESISSFTFYALDSSSKTEIIRAGSLSHMPVLKYLLTTFGQTPAFVQNQQISELMNDLATKLFTKFSEYSFFKIEDSKKFQDSDYFTLIYQYFEASSNKSPNLYKYIETAIPELTSLDISKPSSAKTLEQFLKFYKVLPSSKTFHSQVLEDFSQFIFSLLTSESNAKTDSKYYNSIIYSLFKLSICAHDTLISRDVSLSLIDSLVNQLVNNSHTTILKSKKAVQLLLDVRTEDAKFILEYVQSSSGNEALTKLWKYLDGLKEKYDIDSSSISHQDESDDESEEASVHSSIKKLSSLLSQLDLTSFTNDNFVSLDDLLQNALLVKSELLSFNDDASEDWLSQTNVLIQRAHNMLSGIKDKESQAKLFESLIYFDTKYWSELLDIIYEQKIPLELSNDEQYLPVFSQLSIIDEESEEDEPSNCIDDYGKNLTENFASFKLFYLYHYCATLIASYPELFESCQSSKVKYSTMIGILLSRAAFQVIQKVLITSKLELPQFELFEVLSNHHSQYVLNFTSVFEENRESALELLLDTLASKNIVAESLSNVYVQFVQHLWESASQNSQNLLVRAFYSFVALNDFIFKDIFSELVDTSTTLKVDPLKIKKLVPFSKITNKFGTVAVLNNLQNTEFLDSQFTTLRNNLVGDLVTTSLSQLTEIPTSYSSPDAAYTLNLLALSLKLSDLSKSGVTIFKIFNVAKKCYAVSQEEIFMEAGYSSFLLVSLVNLMTQISRVVTYNKEFSSSFWDDYLSSFTVVIDQCAFFIEEEEFAPYAIVLLNQCLKSYNLASELLEDIESDEGNLEEIEFSLQSASSHIMDSSLVLLDVLNENQDLIRGTPMSNLFTLNLFKLYLKNMPQVIKMTDMPFKLIPFLSHTDLYIQRLAVSVLSFYLDKYQKDKSIQFAIIPNPSLEDSEPYLIPQNLIDLAIKHTPAEFQSEDSSDATNILSSIEGFFLEDSYKQSSSANRSYLYAWFLIFKYFEKSIFVLRKYFMAQIKFAIPIHELGSIDNKALVQLFNYLSSFDDDLLSLASKEPTLGPKTLGITSIDSSSLFTGGRNEFLYFIWNSWYNVAIYSPFELKSWFSSEVKLQRTKQSIDSLISTYLTPLVISFEVQSIRTYLASKDSKKAKTEHRLGDSSEDTETNNNRFELDKDAEDDSFTSEIVIAKSGKAINALFHIDNQTMEISYLYPYNYPLQDIKIEGIRRIGINEKQWRSWILFSQSILIKHDNSIPNLLAASSKDNKQAPTPSNSASDINNIVSSIQLFKRNVSLHFHGIPECAICYSLLNDDDGINNYNKSKFGGSGGYSLPTKKCRTCHNAFHPACLNRWFKSVSTESCPLCRTEKAFR